MSKPMSKKTAIIGLAAAGVLGAGIAVPAIAFAEGAEPNATAGQSASASPKSPADRPDRQDWQRRREAHRDALAEALAAELGVDKEKVAAALEKVREQLRSDAKPRHEGWQRGDHRGRGDHREHGEHRERDGAKAADRQAKLKERLDQAVTDGKLTREQADAIMAAAEAGVLNGPGWGGRGTR